MGGVPGRGLGADDAGVRTVLDVCCGTGLMASELVARGYRITGVDASAAMLARARGLLGPDVLLVEETLPDLTIDASSTPPCQRSTVSTTSPPPSYDGPW